MYGLMGRFSAFAQKVCALRITQGTEYMVLVCTFFYHSRTYTVGIVVRPFSHGVDRLRVRCMLYVQPAVRFCSLQTTT